MLLIRTEIESDHNTVFNINKLAFKHEDEAILTDKLRKGNGFVPELSLVACEDNIAIGYIMFTELSFKNAPHHKSLALAPLAVHPDFQSKGVGATLIKEGMAKARELGYHSVIVLGHKDYYPKFGFSPAEKWDIQTPFGEHTRDIFKAIELVQGSLDTVSGEPRYMVEFFS